MVCKQHYDKMTDEDIIQLIRNQDMVAVDYLLEKYKNLVKNKAKTLFLIGGDKDDLIQEGMIGLYKAIRDYEGANNCTFFSFADLCISRQMYSAINASKRKKNIPLNTYISLDTPVAVNGTDSEERLIDKMFQQNTTNPEELIIDKENTSMIEYELVKCLSNLEKEVLMLYLKDMKYIQIAQYMGKPAKTIDNALTRIKTKLNRVLEKS